MKIFSKSKKVLLLCTGVILSAVMLWLEDVTNSSLSFVPGAIAYFAVCFIIVIPILALLCIRCYSKSYPIGNLVFHSSILIALGWMIPVLSENILAKEITFFVLIYVHLRTFISIFEIAFIPTFVACKLFLPKNKKQHCFEIIYTENTTIPI